MALAEKIHAGVQKHLSKEKEKASKKASSKKKHHFRVEQMDDNTFTVHHRIVPSGKSEYSEPSREETSTHPSIKHVAKHMQECMVDTSGEQESGVAVGPKGKSMSKDDEED